MEQHEKVEEEIPGEIPSEEAPEKKEAVKTKEEEKETEGRVIEIHAPPPFDEEALNPFIDVFMAKRGLADRKQAAVKLANVLFRMGYDPRKDIQNVTTYINNLSTVLTALPDTPETVPVKGALLARGAVDTAGMIGRSHFGERSMNGVDPELKQMLKFAQNAKVTMKILDSAFSGDSSSGDSSEMKEMKARMDRLEGDKALDTKLAPLHAEIRSLQQDVQALLTRQPTKKPDEESAATQKVTALLTAMDKRLDGIDQRYQFTTEVQTIRNEIADLKTDIAGQGGKGPKDVTTVFDNAIKLMDKIKEVTGKYGVGDAEFALGPAIMATVSEISTEAIQTYREIETARREATPGASTPAAQQPEKMTDMVMDKRLLSFIQKQVAKGSMEFNSVNAAKAIGATNDQVLASYQRLVKKGILKNVGEATGTKEQSAEEEEQWVEG